MSFCGCEPGACRLREGAGYASLGVAALAVIGAVVVVGAAVVLEGGFVDVGPGGGEGADAAGHAVALVEVGFDDRNATVGGCDRVEFLAYPVPACGHGGAMTLLVVDFHSVHAVRRDVVREPGAEEVLVSIDAVRWSTGSQL